jgi:hypothetical protein
MTMEKKPNKKCNICGKPFYVKPYFLKKGHGKYCSRECQFKGQLKGKFVECDECGKTVWKMPHDIRHSVSQKFFCSKSCQTVWRNKLFSGPNHPFWTGGLDKYRIVLIENNIPMICKECGLDDKRVLVAHHKDGNRKNKDVNNLEWLCRNCHYLAHNRKTV